MSVIKQWLMMLEKSKKRFNLKCVNDISYQNYVIVISWLRVNSNFFVILNFFFIYFYLILFFSISNLILFLCLGIPTWISVWSWKHFMTKLYGNSMFYNSNRNKQASLCYKNSYHSCRFIMNSAWQACLCLYLQVTISYICKGT